MPKLPIDYSKTIIYKICCNDINISDCYIGHTTDLVRRRNCHKSDCKNENQKNFNAHVYVFIRQNGGWENWSLIPIEEYPCENVIQATIRERYWYKELKATLNSNIPSRTKQEWTENNKNKIKEYKKEYNEKRKEYIKEYKQNHREKNKYEILEKERKYREANKKEIRERQREIINCICGACIQKSNLSRHLKTATHMKMILKDT